MSCIRPRCLRALPILHCVLAIASTSLVLASCEPDDTLSDEGRRRPPGATNPPRAMAPSSHASAPAAPPPPTVDDGQPARFGPLMVTLAVDCVRVQAAATRPVTARAVVEIAGMLQAQDFPLALGATLFDAAFRTTGPAGMAATVHLVATDAGGLELSSDRAAFMVPRPAGRLVITEVLANPAGAETRQEWVELANLGDAPESTAGLRIDDAAGSDELPEALIAAGARALVVGASFDEQAPGDVPPRAGTALLRVPGRIGRDGLGQAGEVVRLVGSDGLVRSSYGGWIDTRRAAWAGQSVHRLPDESACDHPLSWTAAPMPATPGW
jgi:hypothetical protein